MEEYLIALVAWTKLKFRIHVKLDRQTVYFQEREIWWASLGINVGSEQNGKHNNFERPVLVLKKFNQNVLWAIPISSGYKNQKNYLQFFYQNQSYSYILSQLRLISSKRLLRKIRKISELEFKNVKQSMRELL